MTAQVNTRAGRLPYQRGSEWRKWDLHIHTPGTGREDKFTGWPSFLQALKATKDVSVVGVTDYLSIANYEHLIGHKKDAKLGSIELLIPNIEFRVTPQTDKGHAVNLHLLIDPTESAHCDEINHALARLSIEYQRQPYSCTRAGITKFCGHHFVTRTMSPRELQRMSRNGSLSPPSVWPFVDTEVSDVSHTHSGLFLSSLL